MTSTLRTLCELLDPGLVPRGFQAGQSPTDEASGQVIWCAPFPAFRERFPLHPQAAGAGDPTASRGCVDLTLEVVEGELLRMELEGIEVPGTSSLLGRRVDEIGSALAQVVARHLS